MHISGQKGYSSGIIPVQAHLRAKYAVAGRFFIRRQVEIVFACKFSECPFLVRAQRGAGKPACIGALPPVAVLPDVQRRRACISR